VNVKMSSHLLNGIALELQTRLHLGAGLNVLTGAQLFTLPSVLMQP
jgi:hypothetical protein